MSPALQLRPVQQRARPVGRDRDRQHDAPSAQLHRGEEIANLVRGVAAARRVAQPKRAAAVVGPAYRDVTGNSNYAFNRTVALHVGQRTVHGPIGAYISDWQEPQRTVRCPAGAAGCCGW